MDKEQIAQYANEQLNKWGLAEAGWHFIFSNGKTVIGHCHFFKKEIAFSKHYVNIEEAEVKDTILHEIAHALAGGRAGHGKEWKRACQIVGANPKRRKAFDKQIVKPSWVAVYKKGNRLVIAKEYFRKPNPNTIKLAQRGRLILTERVDGKKQFYSIEMMPYKEWERQK